MSTLQDEYTRVAYREMDSRPDHTLGYYTIPTSYFTNAQQIATRLNITRGGCWQVQENYVGGRGDMAQVVDVESGASINLWNDSRGGWWLEDARGNLDLDETVTLMRCLDIQGWESSGNVRRKEAEYYRHP